MQKQTAWKAAAAVFLFSALWGKAQAQQTPMPPLVETTQAMRRAFYAYDAILPLNATVKPLIEAKSNPNSARYSLTYTSVHDQRVTATFALPKRFAAPYPAVILVHGSGGNKNACSPQLSMKFCGIPELSSTPRTDHPLRNSLSPNRHSDREELDPRSGVADGGS